MKVDIHQRIPHRPGRKININIPQLLLHVVREEVVVAREAQQTVINSPRPLPRTAAAAQVVREVEAKVADINSQQSLRMVVVMVVAAVEEGEAVKAVLLADISSRRALMVVVVEEEEVEVQLQAVLEACRQRTQVLSIVNRNFQRW